MTRVFLAGACRTEEDRLLFAWAHTALLRGGYELVHGAPERHTTVPQMVAAMKTAVTALASADVVALVPGFRKGWAIDCAVARGIPVFPAAHLIGWLQPHDWWAPADLVDCWQSAA